jgi:hypothetical protein
MTLIQIDRLSRCLHTADIHAAKRLIFEQVCYLEQYVCNCVTWLISQLLINSVGRLAFLKTNESNVNGGTNC